MDFYYNAPVWDDDSCPHTFPAAEPRQSIAVTNATVIDVQNGGAYYRGASFSGRFVVADVGRIPRQREGSHRIPVLCLWFGHRLVRQAPEILFDLSKCRIIENFTGMVDMNLAR